MTHIKSNSATETISLSHIKIIVCLEARDSEVFNGENKQALEPVYEEKEIFIKDFDAKKIKLKIDLIEIDFLNKNNLSYGNCFLELKVLNLTPYEKKQLRKHYRSVRDLV